jgi:ribonuclease III
MNKIEDVIKKAPIIESKINYTFKDPLILAQAFIHRSYTNEHKHVSLHNERLEFLGDSILGLIIAEHLYLALPDTSEGELSYLRSRLVEASTCVSYVIKLGIAPYLLLGKGERMNDGRGRETILADLFEAVIGAIYLDGGFEAAKHFFFKNFSTEIDNILKMPVKNWKALLQDYCQKKYQKPPIYKVITETGPDHSKEFKINVYLENIELGQGIGSSKKEAQQAAAADAILKLNIETKS